MSAIAGIVHFHNEPVPMEQGTALMEALRKFPADDIQTWYGEYVFLGCHAQWITPESIHEPLPFYDAERKLAITADAIIDNREELFDALQVEYSRRNGMPDSQLILLAYAKWGEDAPKYLIGDFAFTIWDERERKLFGARDFSGARTLYYFSDDRRVSFSTTITPLLTLPYVETRLNEPWLAEFLAISTTVDTVDSSITPYKNIEQVPPSHFISVTGNKLVVSRYCNLFPVRKLKLKSDHEYVEAFQDVFQKAVNSRLRTFHEVGSHLSGGLDSGSVVSFAVQTLGVENKNLHTFSYIPPHDFEDYTPKYLLPDERPFIKETVQHVGGIKDYYLDFEGKDSYSDIQDLLELLEMPYKFFENSFWIKGMFEKARENGIGVILSGGRGNLSVSWGSAIDYYALLLKRMKWVQLVRELHCYSRRVGGPRLRRIPLVAGVAYPSMGRLFRNDTPYRTPMLINEQFAKRTNVFDKLKSYGIDQSGWFSTSDIYEQRIRHFQDVFHWNATNTLGTKLSLYSSVWLRDPTNDKRVIEFCLSVPDEQYVKNGLDRALIRRSTEKLLPDQVRLNQRIRGVQGADWAHRLIPHWGKILNEFEQLITDERALEFLNIEAIQLALHKARQGVQPQFAIDPDFKILMRSLIVSRYLRRFA